MQLTQLNSFWRKDIPVSDFDSIVKASHVSWQAFVCLVDEDSSAEESISTVHLVPGDGRLPGAVRMLTVDRPNAQRQRQK